MRKTPSCKSTHKPNNNIIASFIINLFIIIFIHLYIYISFINFISLIIVDNIDYEVAALKVFPLIALFDLEASVRVAYSKTTSVKKNTTSSAEALSK